MSISYQVNDLHEEYSRVQGKVESMMTKGLRAIIVAFIISQSFMTASYAQEAKSLTVLKPWTKDVNVNGALEAQRRDWLAKVRKMKEAHKHNAKNEIMLASIDATKSTY